MRRSSRVAAFAALAITVAGCSATYTQQPGGGFGPPQIVLSTPGGSYPLYAPPAMPDSAPNLAAPPGFGTQGGGALPSPGGAGSPDGTYDGTASLLQNDFGDCAFRFSMTNMHVSKGRVRFASFHGGIGPDGGVRMADGSLNWITGHFADGHFGGTYSNRYCTYRLSLDRVGP